MSFVSIESPYSKTSSDFFYTLNGFAINPQGPPPQGGLAEQLPEDSGGDQPPR
jgi:hypothetical protein